MMNSAIFVAFVAGLTTAVASPSSLFTDNSTRDDSNCKKSNGILPCDALRQAGLAARVLSPIDDGYEPQIQTWWAENSRLRPFCLILPQTTEEVSQALTALVDVNDGAGDWHIAVRSGGHSMGAFSTIAQGVTIDLSMLNGTSYDEETNIANIQPGGRWKNVYADLDTYGVTVTGGRDGGVGVGGFLLGGGVSFFSGREGFGCDSVLNYEVVLANGTIINANSTHNSDLWKALKGGASNFGIVTRFDMEAVPARTMYHNVRFISAEYADTIVDAVSSFTDHGESLRDDALVTFFSHNATVSPEIYVGMLRVNTQGKTNTSSVFDEIQRLPTIIDVTRYQTMSEVALGSQLSAGARIGFATLTVRNDPELLRQIVDIHAEYVESLKQFLSPEDFNTMMFLQPIPSYLTAIGPQRGGNMLGLDHVEGNLVLWNAGVMLGAEDSASFAKAHALLTAMTAKVKRVSESLGADVEFLYTNYADASQDPIGSYGEENVAFMKEVSAKYDPDGVFQRRVPGGFKVSRVA